MGLKYEPASVPQHISVKRLQGGAERRDRVGRVVPAAQEGRCKATWKKEFKLPWREAGPLNHHDDLVDSDQ